MRRALLALALAALLPATASAAPFQVSDAASLSADAIAEAPEAATDPRANLTLVSWILRDQAGGGTQLWGRLVGPAGAPQGPQFAISSRPIFAHRVAYDGAARRFVVVWDEPVTHTLFARTVAPDGALGPVITVDGPPGLRDGLTIAGSSRAGVLVGWVQSDLLGLEDASTRVVRLRGGSRAGRARTVRADVSPGLALASHRSGWLLGRLTHRKGNPAALTGVVVRRLAADGRGKGRTRRIHKPDRRHTLNGALTLEAGSRHRTLAVWTARTADRHLVIQSRILDRRRRPERRARTLLDAPVEQVGAATRVHVAPAGSRWYAGWPTSTFRRPRRVTTTATILRVPGGAPTPLLERTAMATHPGPGAMALAPRASGRPLVLVAAHTRLRRDVGHSEYILCNGEPCTYANQEILGELG